MHPKTPLSRLARTALAFALALALVPTLAYGDEGAAPAGGATERLAALERQSFERFAQTGDASALYDADASEADGAPAAQALAADALPARFDLRDRGVVTPVKFQNPWGTCWGFAAIAAAETSIMSELGWTVTNGAPLDLSELHLAWFSYTALPADAGPQAGEGSYAMDTSNPSIVLDQGGYPFTATSMFSSGIGPVPEEAVPYRNKEGYTKDKDGVPAHYAREGDWSVDEDMRFAQLIELEESYILPSPAQRDAKGNYQYYNPAGTQAIKDELLAGRAVEICLSADTSKPGEEATAKYINLDTWAHYTYDDSPVNHAVTIVGWDDGYAASNFLDDPDKGQIPPPGPGAWIVKNSWGSIDNEFPHWNPVGWGEDGQGYFHLSYYDKSLTNAESLNFYSQNIEGRGERYVINQYDFMPSSGTTRVELDAPASMANVFTAPTDQKVRSLSCETARPDTTVTYELYLLDEGYDDPTDGKCLASVTETYPYGGYHRVQLDEGCLVEEGRSYAVLATQTRGEPGREKYQVLMDRELNKAGVEYVNANYDAGLTMYAKGVVNRGESFLYDGDAWKDWVDGIAEVEGMGDPDEAGKYDYDNFPIKAYADPIEAPEPEPQPVPAPVPDVIVPVEGDAGGGSSLAPTEDPASGAAAAAAVAALAACATLVAASSSRNAVLAALIPGRRRAAARRRDRCAPR